MNGNRVVSSFSGTLGFVANVLNVGSALASATAFVVWIVFPAAGVVTTFVIEPFELGMMVVDWIEFPSIGVVITFVTEPFRLGALVVE